MNIKNKISIITDKMLLQTLSNHPVHILDTNGHFSPSALIPFCSFGKEFIGIKRKEFHFPVCDIFKPKLHYNQLCYETDLQELNDSNHKNLINQLEIGLTLTIDYNEERQLLNIKERNTGAKKESNGNHEKQFAVYLEAIGSLFYGCA